MVSEIMKKFNKDKYLKQLKFKRFYRKYERYFYIGIPCLLVSILGIYFAYSKFTTTADEEVVKTTVGDFVYGDVVINNYVNGEYVVEAPAKGTGYHFDKIVCDNGAVGEWSVKDWGLTISNVTKRSKCSIYFVDNEKIKFGNTEVILDVYSRCPSLNDDGTVTVRGPENTYGYLCKAKDAYGDSYYFRGNVTNNYVLFGGFYWRIIRMNGDGSIRVIYDGTSAHANEEESTDRQIGTSAFNSKNDDNAYVGYMYGKVGASTYAETHANTNNSTIKTYIDTWYENNIKSTSNEKYIVDNLFCNDRSLAPNNSGTGAGNSYTYYRWNNVNNDKIMLTCPQKNDAFTVNDTSKGNGALTYGIGLIAADEVVLSGGLSLNDNIRYYLSSGQYLYFGQYYWSSSPSGSDRYYPGIATVRCVDCFDHDMDDGVRTGGVRPVISLTSEVLEQGDGTASNPFHLAS